MRPIEHVLVAGFIEEIGRDVRLVDPRPHPTARRYTFFAEHATVFSAMGAETVDTLNLVVAGEPWPVRVSSVTDGFFRALGVTPTWDDGEAWTGQISADRARGWGWSPQVSLEDALAELKAGLRA